jgi:hypothetical protein
LGQSCDISFAGQATQTDDCDAGLVCLAASCGRRCYQFCRADQDCTNATCTRDVGGGQRVCDVPFAQCNPILNGMPDGCPNDSHGCYLIPTGNDRTVCDCPISSARENMPCTLSRECFPGLVCVDPANTMEFRCRRVCSLTGGSGGSCPGSGSCRELGGGRMFGFCDG